ncbi:hypothetical protein [Dactylosporangium sp. CA-092794]|uniref:hypothetical protein n=1 Tax=Dactylosporangium sp. CA-092794 TaxID=3239929 RepID=UPI003D943E44
MTISSSIRDVEADRLIKAWDAFQTTILTDPTVTLRFDGSDMMPASVGAGTFWAGMTGWIKRADTATVLHRIETGWPA